MKAFIDNFPHIKNTRINDKIVAQEVSLVTDGQPPQTLSLAEALSRAEAAGLDLVEVNPNAKPPIVKILDYGKFLYKKSKQEQIAKKGQTKIELKTIRFGFRIGEHDMEIRRNQAIKFFEKGHIVKLQMVGRGREMAYKALAIEKLQKFIESLQEFATVEQTVKTQGNNITCTLKAIKKV